MARSMKVGIRETLPSFRPTPARDEAVTQLESESDVAELEEREVPASSPGESGSSSSTSNEGNDYPLGSS